MRFKVLGPLEVSRDDGPIQLGGPRQRAVLAHLLVRVNELVPADLLIDQMWGDEPPDAARGTLHSYISHLRKALGAERIEGRTTDLAGPRKGAERAGADQLNRDPDADDRVHAGTVDPASPGPRALDLQPPRTPRSSLGRTAGASALQAGRRTLQL
jgi:hypothetical protein